MQILLSIARLAEVLETNRPFIAREFPADEVLGEEMVVVDGDFESECWREQCDGELASTFGSCVRAPVEAAGRHWMDCEVLIEEIVAGVDETAPEGSLASIPSGSICRP
jgi:hypothetical protein